MRTLRIISTIALLLLSHVFSVKAEVLMNMVALEEVPVLTGAEIARVLNTDWGMNLIADSVLVSETAGAFDMDGEMVALMIINKPIPWEELDAPCSYASLWADASVKMKSHKAHIIPVILSDKKPILERYKLLTKLTCALMKLSKPVGVYHAAHQLVVSPEVYLSGGDQLKLGNLPLANWLFIGVSTVKANSSGFTIGLETFGYKELEIIKSEHTSKEVFAFLFEVSNYVLSQNVIFKNGETVGFSGSEKIPVKLTGSAIRKKAKVFLLGY